MTNTKYRKKKRPVPITGMFPKCVLVESWQHFLINPPPPKKKWEKMEQLGTFCEDDSLRILI